MQMHYIRLNLIKSSKKAFRSSLTMKTSPTIYASLERIEFNLHVGGELHFARFFRLTATTPERIRFLASCEEFTVFLHHNAASRPVRHRVYVSINSHYRLFLHTILSTTPV